MKIRGKVVAQKSKSNGCGYNFTKNKTKTNCCEVNSPQFSALILWYIAWLGEDLEQL